jgi:EAL domain-containing protein (putative c-di-GMP-specific phosphodiesterase class I)
MQPQLREALKHGEFSLCYQPQICLRDGRITALEALLRWQRSDRDTILPATFIPIAERSGQIIPIGDWVRRSRRQDRSVLPPASNALVNRHQRAIPDQQPIRLDAESRGFSSADRCAQSGLRGR